jgi:outer membrane protein TolC
VRWSRKELPCQIHSGFDSICGSAYEGEMKKTEWRNGNVSEARTECAPGETLGGAMLRTRKGITAFCSGVGFVLICAIVPAGHAQTVALQSPQGQAAAPEAATPETQLVYPPKPAEQTGAPQTITFGDALQRAQKYNAEFLSAQSDQKSAREDRVQARNARLPQFGAHSEYIGTQGNGVTPNGRYVTNDGVHVYREWAVMRQDISANSILGTDYKKSQAAEAIAAAKAEIARRGLTVTVTKAYYGLVVAQRKYATQQQALEQARRFLQITQDLERVGQAAHSDVVKAQIQYNQQETAFADANLGMRTSRR